MPFIQQDKSLIYQHITINFSLLSQLKISDFFDKNLHNFIKFWDCLSKDKWALYVAINKETK